jgi:hypothetical protein
VHAELDNVEEATADARRSVELLETLAAAERENPDYAAQLEAARDVQASLGTPL